MKRVIGPGQLIALLLCTRIIVTLNFPFSSADSAFTVSTALGTLCAFPVMVFLSLPGTYLSCGKRITPVECAYGFSKITGTVFAAVYALYFFAVSTITVMRYDTFALATMQNGDLPVIFPVLFAIPVLYAAIKGIEPLARFAGIIAVLSIAAIVIIFLLLTPRISSYNITSPFYDGVGPVIKGGVLIVSNSTELVMFSFLAPKAKETKFKHFALFSFSSTITVALIIFTVVSVLGEYTQTQLFPYYTAAGLVGGEAIERMEAVQSGVWIILAFLKSALCLYMCGVCLGRIIPKKHRKLMYTVLCVLSAAISITLSSREDIKRYTYGMYPSLILILLLGAFVPLVFSVVLGIKNKKKPSATEV